MYLHAVTTAEIWKCVYKTLLLKTYNSFKFNYNQMYLTTLDSLILKLHKCEGKGKKVFVRSLYCASILRLQCNSESC